MTKVMNNHNSFFKPQNCQLFLHTYCILSDTFMSLSIIYIFGRMYLKVCVFPKYSNISQVTCVILDTIKLISTPHWNEPKFQIRSRASISFLSIYLNICTWRGNTNWWDIKVVVVVENDAVCNLLMEWMLLKVGKFKFDFLTASENFSFHDACYLASIRMTNGI